MVIGRSVRVASDAFRVVIRAADFRQYEALLPSGSRFAICAEAIDAFAPSHLEWDLTLEIDEADVPPARLDGRCQLGWTGWLKPRRRHLIRADAHLSRTNRHIKRRKGVPR
jgi:type VI secretion system protein ImpH